METNISYTKRNLLARDGDSNHYLKDQGKWINHSQTCDLTHTVNVAEKTKTWRLDRVKGSDLRRLNSFELTCWKKI